MIDTLDIVDTIITDGAAVAAEPQEAFDAEALYPEFMDKIKQLRQQEQELRDLEEQLKTLKELKQTMAEKKALIEQAAQQDEEAALEREQRDLYQQLEEMTQELQSLEERQEALDEDVTVEDLMERLQSASVEEPQETAEETQGTVEQQAEGAEQEMLETSEKIGNAVNQIRDQMEQLRQVQHLAETEEEKAYCSLVLEKMNGQLEELLVAQEKVTLYQQLLEEYRLTKDKQEALESESNQARVQTSDDVQEQPVAQQVAEQEEEDLEEPLSTDSPAIVSEAQAVRGDDEVSTPIESLYQQQHQRLERAADNLIQGYKHSPGFLLTVLKSLAHLKSDTFAQQKLLCVLDELTDERDETVADDTETEPIRARIHHSTFKFVEQVFTGETIAPERVQDLIHHVNSMLYAHLISTPSKHVEAGLSPEEAIRAMGQFEPILGQITQHYSSQPIDQAPMLAYEINRFFDAVFGWEEL